MNEWSQDDITSIFVHEIALIPSAYILVAINKDYWNFVSNPSHDDRQIDVTIPHNAIQTIISTVDCAYTLDRDPCLFMAVSNTEQKVLRIIQNSKASRNTVWDKSFKLTWTVHYRKTNRFILLTRTYWKFRKVFLEVSDVINLQHVTCCFVLFYSKSNKFWAGSWIISIQRII